MQMEVDTAVSVSDTERHEAIRELLFEEKGLFQGERKESKEPFFRPVSIAVDGGVTIIAGFSRDISTQGIGLVHLCPIPPGEVVVEVSVAAGRPRFFRVQILWCNRIAAAWYISGGRILELLPNEEP